MELVMETSVTENSDFLSLVKDLFDKAEDYMKEHLDNLYFFGED